MANKVIQATKGKSLVTPKGSAMWVKILEPDFTYDTKGKYEAQIVCDPNDETVQKFVATLEKLNAAGLEEARENLKPPKNKSVAAREVVQPEIDKEGNETGMIVIKAKAPAEDYEGNKVTIPVYDVKGRKEEGFNKLIGNGSTIKMEVWAFPYHMANGNTVGVSLRLKKVQVIDLLEYGGNDGFTDESGEEGFGDTDETFAATGTDF